MAKRNESCPCGSGKKFKKCCLRGESSTSEKPYVSVIDRMAEAFKDIHPEWKKFLAEDCRDYLPENFEERWPDAVNDVLLEEWIDWEDLLLPPTQELKEEYYIKKASHKKWGHWNQNDKRKKRSCRDHNTKQIKTEQISVP